MVTLGCVSLLAKTTFVLIQEGQGQRLHEVNVQAGAQCEMEPEPMTVYVLHFACHDHRSIELLPGQDRARSGLVSDRSGCPLAVACRHWSTYWVGIVCDQEMN